MVVSNIIQNIKFKEDKSVEKHDKKAVVSIFRITLFDTDVNVSLGKVNTSLYNDIYFAPVYLILNENVQIDFSAIAKGWGVDRVSLFLNDQGFENYLVEVGGEIRVAGVNNFNSEWSLGIFKPEDSTSELYTTITISDLAVATSGSYNNYFILENTNYSHIINPQIGYPIKHDLVSATVIADDCATADAIATAVMVKGFNLGLEWINSLPDIECLLVKANDSGSYITGKSSGFNY